MSPPEILAREECAIDHGRAARAARAALAVQTAGESLLIDGAQPHASEKLPEEAWSPDASSVHGAHMMLSMTGCACAANSSNCAALNASMVITTMSVPLGRRK
jgi:hypothetical protein